MCEILLMHRSRLLMLLLLPLLMVLGLNHSEGEARFLSRRSTSDKSVSGYLTERTCWWNEVCKEEFQSLFRCKCPEWSFCRAPGRYYNAFCSMTATGYIWMQPLFQASSHRNNQDPRSLSPAIKKK